MVQRAPPNRVSNVGWLKFPQKFRSTPLREVGTWRNKIWIVFPKFSVCQGLVDF
jgi:hypothetical protein